MARRKPSKAELEITYKIQRAAYITSVINNLIRWGGLVTISFFIYRSVQSLASHTTIADIKLFGELELHDLLLYALGGGGLLYGLRQKKLRGDNIERMGPRNKELEAAIDIRRSTSGLTARGNTNPMDFI